MKKDLVVKEGALVGLIASASVAIFYALFDALAARGTLYTVNVLSQSLFREFRFPTLLGLPMALDWGAIFMYSLLHLAISLVIGITVVWLIALAKEVPRASLPALAVIVAGFPVTVLLVGYITQDMRVVLPWWSITVANAVSVMLAGGYLLYRHPGVWRRFVP